MMNCFGDRDTEILLLKNSEQQLTARVKHLDSVIECRQSELAALREELADRKRKHLRSCQIAIGKSQLAKERHAELIALREELARKDKVIQAFHDGYGYQDVQQRLAAAEQQAAKAFESAARWVEARRDDYVNDHGSIDPETGTVEFPGNGEEYVGELDEIAEGLRSLKPTESGASE